MTTRTNAYKAKPGISLLRLMLLSSLTAFAALVASGSTTASDAEQAHADHELPLRPNSFKSFATPRGSSSTSTQPQLPATSRSLAASAVRITGQWASLRQRPAGRGREIDASRPEALIYEPSEGGLQLVGVEFIVDAATWLTKS